MKRVVSLVAPIVLLAGCETSNALMSYQPVVYKPSGYSLSVTRPAMATSTDTTRVANEYCGQFDRVASITKLASPWIAPMRDEFVCVEKDEEQ